MAYGSFEHWMENFYGKRDPDQASEKPVHPITPYAQSAFASRQPAYISREEALKEAALYADRALALHEYKRAQNALGYGGNTYMGGSGLEGFDPQAEMDLYADRVLALKEYKRMQAAREPGGAAGAYGVSPDALVLPSQDNAPYNEAWHASPQNQPYGGIDDFPPYSSTVPGYDFPYGLPVPNALGNTTSIFQLPGRALASAGAAANSPASVIPTDLGQDTEPPHAQAAGADDNTDEEVYWEVIRPQTTSSPAPLPTAARTLFPSLYTIDLAEKSGYEKNRDVYPGATETTLMPLAYYMQAQAKMIKDGYTYSGAQDISGSEKRSDCVGMSRLPGVSWYPSARMKNGKYAEDRYPRMFTTVGGMYRNASHKGLLTADTEKFNGMQLITKNFTHVVTYYKEFFDGEEMHYDVIVHIAGEKYIDIDEETMTPDEIADAEEKNRKKAANNKNRKAEWMPIDKAIEKYKLDFVYWCAPDYIDYGDQEDPETGMPLTPQKTVEVRKKK